MWHHRVLLWINLLLLKCKMWVLVIAMSSMLNHALPNKIRWDCMQDKIDWSNGYDTLVLDSLTCGFTYSVIPSESVHELVRFNVLLYSWSLSFYTGMYGTMHGITCAVSERVERASWLRYIKEWDQILCWIFVVHFPWVFSIASTHQDFVSAWWKISTLTIVSI